jgi:hypothetical protein
MFLFVRWLLRQPNAAQLFGCDATCQFHRHLIGRYNVIDGGTTADTNLFHSFESFCPSGGRFFNNAMDFEIERVDR